MKYKKGCGLIFLAITFTHEIHAQGNDPEAERKVNDLDSQVVEAANEKFGGIDLENPVSVVPAGIQISGSTDDKTAIVSFSPKYGTNTFNIKISTPLDKETKSGNFTDFKSLDKITSVELNYQRVLAFSKIAPSKLVLVHDDCEAQPSRYGLNIATDCDDLTLTELIDAFEKTTGKEYLNEVHNTVKNELGAPLKLLGFTVGYGEDDYSYFAQDTANKESSNENSWSASIYYSWSDPDVYLNTIEYEYAESYEEADKEIRCAIASTTIFNTCQQLAKAKPEQNQNSVLSFNSRRSISNSVMNFAISPKLAYDFEDDHTYFSLPVFLIPDADRDFNGGVKAEWDDKDEDWVFSIFVGTKLSRDIFAR